MTHGEAGMHTYWVWDEAEGEGSARKITAHGPDAAAVMYAESDTDFLRDGGYETGHVLCVQDDQRRTSRITVTVDYDPVFYTDDAPDPEVVS